MPVWVIMRFAFLVHFPVLVRVLVLGTSPVLQPNGPLWSSVWLNILCYIVYWTRHTWTKTGLGTVFFVEFNLNLMFVELKPFLALSGPRMANFGHLEFYDSQRLTFPWSVWPKVGGLDGVT